MILRKNGFVRIIFVLISLQVFTKTEGVPTFRRTGDTIGKGNELSDGVEKDSVDHVGCKSGDRILQPGEAEQRPICTYATCLEVNGTYVLEVLGCDPTNEIPPNCELVPQPEKLFPECCVIVMVCTHVYSSENVSRIGEEDTKDVHGSAEDGGMDLNDSETTGQNQDDFSFDGTEPLTTQEPTGSSTTKQPVASPVTQKPAVSLSSQISAASSTTRNPAPPTTQTSALSNTPKHVTQIIQKSAASSTTQKPATLSISSTHQSGTFSSDQPAEASSADDLIAVERKKRELPTPYEDHQAKPNVCKMGNSTLEVGESISLEGCTRMDCVKEEGAIYSVILGCKPSKTNIPEGCTIQPRPDAQFPDCCDTVFVCVKSVVKVVPVIVTKENISQIILNEKENSVVDTKDKFQVEAADPKGMKSDQGDTVEPSTIQRSRRQLESKSEVPEIMNPEQTCEANNRILNVGENVYFEECLEAKCVSTNDTSALVLSSCSTPDDIPSNCRIRPNPGRHYPDCCVITLICEKVVTTVVPVVYTHANISELDRNELENMIGVDETVALMNDKDNRKKPERRLKTRSAEPTEQELGQGCSVGGRMIGVGDVMPIQGCSQFECTQEGDEFELLLVGCGSSNATVPEGCFIKPKPELKYPACCVVEMVCEEVMDVVTPVTVTANNINKINIDQKENLIKDYKLNMNPEAMEPVARSNSGPASQIGPDHKEAGGLVREKRSAVTNVQDIVMEKAACIVGNITLDVEAKLSLPGCAQMICLPVNETLGIFIQSCVEEEVPSNCRVEAETELQFPDCCSKFMVCEEVITTVFPVVYTAANISELERNDLENMVEHNNANLNTKAKEKDVDFELKQKNVEGIVKERKSFIPERIRRQVRSRRQRNKPEKTGCKIGNNTLSVEESVPLQKGCAQLKCISKESTPSLVVVSCGSTKSSPPEGCNVLPKPEQQYPQCCEVAYTCEKVIMTVFPVVYTAANISELERDETINAIGMNLDNIHKAQFHNPYLTLDNMDVSQSKIIERTRIKPTPRKVDRTAKTEDTNKKRGSVANVDKDNARKTTIVKEKTDRPQENLENTRRKTVAKDEQQSPQGFRDNARRTTTKKVEVDRPQVVATNIRSRARKQKKENAKKVDIVNTNDDKKDNPSGIEKEVQKRPRRRGRTRTRISEVEKIKTDSPKEEKSVGNRGRNRYKYRGFYERSRRYANPVSESEVKPIFVLPVRASSRSRNDNSNAKKDDLDALELKNSMFVTVTPDPLMTIDASGTQEDSKKIFANEEKPARRRGNLSALLSSRNLRTAASASKNKNKKSEGKEKKIKKFPKKKVSKMQVKKSGETQENKPIDKQIHKETKTEKTTDSTDLLSRRQRLRNRLKDGNITDTARIAQRRRLYADRLNRFRAVVKAEDNEKLSSSVDVKKKETEKVEKKDKEKEDTKEEIKKEEISAEPPRRNPISSKILLRQRLNSRRRNTATAAPEETKTDTEKTETTKKEPPKKITIRARGNKKDKKPGILGKVTIDEGYTKTRYQRRRSRPSKKREPVSPKEETEIVTPQKVNTRARSRNKKPVFTLKTVDENNEGQEDRGTARGRSVFDLSNIEFPKKSDETKQVPVRNRATSRSRNLRKRLKDERRQNLLQKARDHEKQPEEIIVTVTEPPVTPAREIEKLPVQTIEREEERHPYPIQTDHQEPVHEIPQIYGPEQDPDYPYIPTFKGMEDFGKFYDYPTDLHLSSSVKDSEKSPNAKQNEISDDPAAPPIKITTISFTSSRRSFKSSKTRNSSKNYGETPPVYGSEESFKSTKYR